MNTNKRIFRMAAQRVLFAFLALALVMVSPVAYSTDSDSRTETTQPRPSAGAMIVDGLVVRPLSLAGTIIGTGLFIATLPFSAAGGNVEEAGERLVAEPARATFGQCLGCMPYYTSQHPRDRYREHYGEDH